MLELIIESYCCVFVLSRNQAQEAWKLIQNKEEYLLLGYDAV
jgi:hypothetical protein